VGKEEGKREEKKGRKEKEGKEIIRLIYEIAQALCILSKSRIIHRDIKTRNIFMCNNGLFKLGSLFIFYFVFYFIFIFFFYFYFFNIDNYNITEIGGTTVT
jgi:serine/threonine protein kinase